MGVLSSVLLPRGLPGAAALRTGTVEAWPTTPTAASPSRRLPATPRSSTSPRAGPAPPRRGPIEEAAGDPEELDIPAGGTAASPDESYGEPVGAESDVEGQPGIPE